MNVTSRAIAETIGVLGVMGSLVFVGLEVRQSTIATRAATNAQVADAFREFNLALATNPEMMEILGRVDLDFEGSSERDQAVALSLWRAAFHIFSNVHRQWLNGTLDQPLYDSVVAELAVYSEAGQAGNVTPSVARRAATMRWAWESEKVVFNSEFQEFVDGILATGHGPD